MTGLLVAADDRTGALEVAGTCATAGGGAFGRGVLVHVGRGDVDVHDTDGEPVDGDAIVVVDLATRHLGAAAAGAVAALFEERSDARLGAHKIDSTLRGNWAYELVARHRASGRRVLVVPAFPAVGRRCQGGVVTVHGVRVAESAAGTDARGPVRSSRPAELLRQAGATEVAEVADQASLRAWLAAGAPFAVCDAIDDDDLRRIARAWSTACADVLFAGTAGSIGFAAGTLVPARVAPVPVVPDLPALVVCGSLHPMARAQVGALVGAGASERVVGVERAGMPAATTGAAGRVLVLSSPAPAALPVSDVAAHEVVVALAGAAAAEIAGGRWRTVIVIGGDTAAALLGDASVMVGGTVTAGMPWFRLADADGPLFVTKAGGFGEPDTLTDLLLERTTG